MNPFRQANQNRRRDKGFTLNLRSAGDSPRRIVRRRWWWRPVTWAVLLLGLWFGGGMAISIAREQWLYHLDSLGLKTVSVVRDGVLSDDEIRRIAGVKVGRNALTLDLYDIRQRLMRHPRLSDARVRLFFPDRLQLEVKERVPIARALLPKVGGMEAFYLLDEAGHVILPFEQKQAPQEIIESEASLPLLTGVKVTSFTAGTAIADPQVLAALRLLSEFEASDLAGKTDLLSIDIGTSDTLVALTAQGAQVTFAPDDFDRQLHDWRIVLERAASIGKLVGTLDLSVRQNAPLRWLGTNAPPANEAVVKPSKPKRKQVRRHV